MKKFKFKFKFGLSFDHTFLPYNEDANNILRYIPDHNILQKSSSFNKSVFLYVPVCVTFLHLLEKKIFFFGLSLKTYICLHDFSSKHRSSLSSLISKAIVPTSARPNVVRLYVVYLVLCSSLSYYIVRWFASALSEWCLALGWKISSSSLM